MPRFGDTGLASGKNVRVQVTRVLIALGLSGCASAPSPLVPWWSGSIGTPSRGVLVAGTELSRHGEGLRWLRGNNRHWATHRTVAAIQRAAAEVARFRPGPPLAVGDLSPPNGGGPVYPHFSHRSGRDADLLFYVTTLEGAPIESPGFVHFGADGIACEEGTGRWFRLDVAREWRLIRSLVLDPEAHVQWIFVSDVVQALLIDWASADGTPATTIRRAQAVMAQPKPGGVHDDHIHVRTACSEEEEAAGCETGGPVRAWLAFPGVRGEAPSDAELVAVLVQTAATDE